jgi:phosphoribosyl 1,2-cyclic phosphodiesterase
LSARELCRRLALVGSAAESLDGILVTHEHVDHIRGLGVLSRRFNLPVYLHHEIAAALADSQRPQRVVEFATDETLDGGDFAVRAFPGSHDAQAPVGFTLAGPAGKLGVATDLGLGTRLVAEELRDCRVVVMYSIHDPEMLRDGPYPWPLKQLIRGSHGHLSNHDSAEMLGRLCWDGLEAVFLAHLSETNNHPDLARQTAEQVLARQHRCRPHLLVGCQDRPIGYLE